MEKVTGTKEEFMEIFRDLCHSRNSWQVWSDLIACMACSIANTTDRKEPGFSKREKEFKDCIERLGGVDKPAKCLAVITQALERNPDQDFLGALYMELNLGSHWSGQFFTPFSVSEMMAGVNNLDEIKEKIEKKGYITVNDPSCGAGSTLVAFASRLRKAHINYQNSVFFIGQDIDRIVGMMCYIQLSLLGCPGYVVIANTLTNPLVGNSLEPAIKDSQECWYTPFYFNPIWKIRAIGEKLKVHKDQDKKCEEDTLTEKHVFYFNFKKKGDLQIEYR